MPRARLYANQDRILASLRPLQGRRKLEAVRREHAVIVIGGGDQRFGIARPSLDIVIRRVGIERFEFRGVLRRAIVADPSPSYRELVKSKHVQNSHRRQTSPKEIRPLRHARADKQPAVAGPVNRQLLRARVFVRDQPFRGSDEVVEHILLFGLHPCLMPLLAILPAPAEIWNGVNASHFHPGQRGD